MGCCSFIGKYLLFLVNLAFALAGLAVIIVGAVYRYQFDNVLEVLPDEATVLGVTPTLAIVVGCIVFVIAFFGCCGAINEGRCMLTTYAVFVFIILIVQVAIGIYAFVQFNDNQDLQSRIRTQLTRTFSRYDTVQTAREAVDFVQRELRCCGVDSPLSWGVTVPNSCCASSTSTCTVLNAYTQGCSSAITNWLQDNVRIIGIVAIVIAIVELLSGIIACCQIRSINKRYHV